MRVILSLSLSGLMLICLSGCPGSAPSFVLSSKTKDLVPAGRTKVAETLKENFGDPLNLVAWEKMPIDYGKQIGEKDKPDYKPAGWKLLEGRNLYMQHCIHCHGVTGDGNGPTAKFLNPRPRDYRLGRFKFTSTLTGLKPNRGDLVTILKNGIPGTSMPSFKLLPEDQLTAMVEYVRWLSARGEYEHKLSTAITSLDATEKGVLKILRENKGKTREAVLQDLDKAIADNLPQYLEEVPSDIADDWTKAEDPESVVVPSVQRVEPTAASIAEGRKLFLSDKTKCADCHGKSAEGNGVATDQYWPITGSNLKYDEVGLHDDWGNLQLPRNLTRGQYRGGRRPIDLFRRIYAGIKGTQMPAFGKGSLTDEQIWHVVNYVMSVPFEGDKPKPETAPEKKTSVAATR